jgi:glutamate synthase domain-containing protein 2
MIALGCIQSLKCDTNKCPTGVTTNNPSLMRGLVVEDKWERVKNYHYRTLQDFLELFAAAGCTRCDQLSRKFIHKKVGDEIFSYEQLYPTVSDSAYVITNDGK